ncbi:MAG TPA: DUF3592 domain-containing protein [Chthoniobacter sp.]
MPTSPRQAASARQQRTAGLGCIRVFFGLFLVVGCAVFYTITLHPLLQIAAATKWVKTPCVVDFSGVIVQPGSRSRDRPTYSPEIRYHYEFHGYPYSSDRYQFLGGSISRQSDVDRIAKQYPPGRNTVCYLNPNAPAEAVLNRSANSTMIIGCAFLVFVAVGGFGLWYAPRLATPQRAASTKAMPAAVSTGGESVEIKPQVTPLSKFIGLLVFGLFWNAFTSIFVYLIFFAPGHQNTPIFAKIFIGVFVLIGVLVIFAAISKFLALFNPRVKLMTRTPAIPLGAELRFEWKILGPAEKLKKLSIRLEGSEQASYHSGKSTQTATHVFADIPVIEMVDRDVVAEGQARVMVPANLMHTFTGQYNRITWRLRLRGENPHLPALEEEYPIVVLPAPLSAS